MINQFNISILLDSALYEQYWRMPDTLIIFNLEAPLYIGILEDIEYSVCEAI